MSLVHRRLAAGIALAAGLFARPAFAQQLPTPDQARRVIETRPDLVAQLRREIGNSGLTPDQIRARLRAAGYPEDLLDSYLDTRNPRGRDSTGIAVPTEDVIDAVAALGIVDSVDTSELRGLLRRRPGRGSVRADARLADSVLDADSTTMNGTTRETRVDSLGRLIDAPRRRPLAPNADTGQTIFGLNVFANGTTQFDPNLAGPVDANYRLGPGDRLVLIITGDAERAFTLDVTREGFIVIPGVGEVPVANLSLGQLEDQLYARLGRVYSGLRRGAGATTHFSLNVARLHSNQIYVLGDVAQPGSYRISSAGTALTALYAAGGPSLNGGMRRIEIRRGGKLVDTLDLYDYMLRADGSHDPRLQSGDVVFVPVHGSRVRVYGEVVRPGTYEMRRGESLADLLQAAGGFTAVASRRRIQVSRVLPPSQRDTTERARVIIDVTAPDPEVAPAFPLEPGDVVRIFRVADRVGQRVGVHGNVENAGTVGFVAGMKLSDAVRLAGGLKQGTYLDQVLISRLRGADSSRIQVRAAFRDSTGRPRDDIALQPDDEIRIFAITEFRAPEFVAITGAVRRPGRYAYRSGMTLRDLVLLAGGLDPRASIREAEVAHTARSRDGTIAVSERVALDSSYLTIAQMRASAAAGVTQASLAREIALQPYDNVLIAADGESMPRQIVITGEVGAPGSYTLLTRNDRLSDVLRRAGGLTRAANSDGIAFYRKRGHLGRVGVDLAAVLRDSTARDNLVLADGDSIHLPPASGIVEVQGSVNAPRGVAWVPGRALDYYVRAAGGVAARADVRDAYVTQPDGKVESVQRRRFRPDVIPEPRPGSVVFVTKSVDIKGPDPIARLSIIAQIVGSLVAIIAVTRR